MSFAKYPSFDQLHLVLSAEIFFYVSLLNEGTFS
jgi:hypothetical protein